MTALIYTLCILLYNNWRVAELGLTHLCVLESVQKKRVVLSFRGNKAHQTSFCVKKMNKNTFKRQSSHQLYLRADYSVSVSRLHVFFMKIK